jgi:hypothetical protein
MEPAGSDLDDPHREEGRWQIWAGAVVLLGCLLTAAYAVMEMFWG